MVYLLADLKRHGHLDGLHVTVCIAGSRKGDKNDPFATQAWPLLAPNLTIYGFDADEKACADMNADLEKQAVPWTERHFPLALWSSPGKQTLYIRKPESGSSFYLPNEQLVRRFGFGVDTVDSTKDIATTTLDTFFADRNDDVDFLQMDVEGAELPVLQGASRVLTKGVLGIVAEVSFMNARRGQPLFTDIDLYLRGHGFSLFRLGEIMHHCRRDIPFRGSSGVPESIAGANAYYLRDLLAPDRNQGLYTPERLLKLACIADILDFPGFAVEVLVHLTENHGTERRYNCADAILDCLYQATGGSRDMIEALPLVTKLKRLAPKTERGDPSV